MFTGPHPRCPLPPHPNPPPRRGEGRVGVIRLEILMQRLGLVKKKHNQTRILCILRKGEFINQVIQPGILANLFCWLLVNKGC
jgi:hypothetical protein